MIIANITEERSLLVKFSHLFEKFDIINQYNRFTVLSLVSEPWWSLITEALEVFTLGIMWVTAILYLRHLVPRHLTVTAQALPVIAHFCVGMSRHL